MIQVDVAVNTRNTFGKGAAKTLRREGLTPAILYGPKTEPMPLQVDTHSFTQTLLKLQRRNVVVTLDIDGKDKRSVMVKDLQVDPVEDTLNHADFYEINLEAQYNYTVPLSYVGKAKGVDLGGVMEISVHDVQLKGAPLSIPDEVEIDVSDLGVGDSISYADLALPEGVTLVSKADKSCVAVIG
ncbi:MAG: 50S ribosomal protein L25 [Thermodesulfobacteriota bacterium]